METASRQPSHSTQCISHSPVVLTATRRRRVSRQFQIATSLTSKNKPGYAYCCARNGTTLARCSRSEERGGGRRRCRPVTTPAATCVSLSRAPTRCSRQRDCSRHRKLPLRCALAQTAAPPPPPDRRLSELRNGRGTRFNGLLRFVSLSPPNPCCGARIHHVFSRTTSRCLPSSAHVAYPAGLHEGVACLLVSGSLTGGAPR